VVGFCYGGGIAHFLATRLPDLAAVVPFYGMAPSPEIAAQVKAELLIHLADQDERINMSWPPYQAALKAAGVKFEVYRYPGTQHGLTKTPRLAMTKRPPSSLGNARSRSFAARSPAIRPRKARRKRTSPAGRRTRDTGSLSSVE